VAVEPLQSLGLQRAWESARESAVPVLAVTTAWGLAGPLLRAPSAGRPLSELELGLILGGLAAGTSWAVARQWSVFGRRRPVRPTIWGTLLALGAVALAGTLTATGFASWCTDTLGGVLSPIRLFDSEASPFACTVSAVPGNPYLKGTVVVPNWDGELRWFTWVAVGASAVLAAVGFRDLRIWRSTAVHQLAELLQLAPSGGLSSVAGPPKPTEGKVVACRNATLWGELCGQLYAAEREFGPGEWCVRCQQPFRPAERTLEVTIVSLATAELDVLNGLERLDMQSWGQGERPPPDPRISGEERWVVLGTASLPDVISVAQALALAMETVSAAEGGTDARESEAARLAVQRASRIACWFWQGRPLDRLTYARPTDDVVLGVGATRLRDLLPESGEQIVLQLEIGLLPVELRTGFRKRFLDPERPDEVRNTKQDLWVPVGPLAPIREAPGTWVPRVQGEALRIWLALDRVQPEGVRGVTVPLPYRPPHEPGPAVPRPHPPEGYDIVRLMPRSEDGEPDLQRRPGDSLSEWDWLEPETIALLRREMLVLLDPREAR
jgi:hypothetical protein